MSNKMLIIKISINDKDIDEIHVQNIGKFDDIFQYQRTKKRPNLYVYKIVKPEGFGNQTVVHTRNHGHRVLISKVMNVIKHSRRSNGTKIN